MRFSFIPREEKFHDLFDQAAAIITRAAGKFVDLITHFDRIPERARELKEEEHACDEIVAKLIEALDRSFITPFDREDIHTLATRLDEILDNMEETAKRIEIFRIERAIEPMPRLANIILECCKHIEQAIKQCRDLKHPARIQEHIKEIIKLENEADLIYRNTESALFANPPDLLSLIKWRELHGWLEETVDACKDVALVISEIVVKGS